MRQFSIEFPIGMPNKIAVIKALRIVANLGLREAKDLCETHTVTHIINVDTRVSENDLGYQIRTLQSQGCVVGSPAHQILQNLRELATQALEIGEDELANEILQLVLAEKLRRQPA